MKPTRNKFKALVMTFGMILWNILKFIGLIAAAGSFSALVTWALAHSKIAQLLFVGVTCTFVVLIAISMLVGLFRDYWRKYYYYGD